MDLPDAAIDGNDFPKAVMPGLDPGIHLLREKSSGEGDGLPGQARQ
jgi:hypothetical protein